MIHDIVFDENRGEFKRRKKEGDECDYDYDCCLEKFFHGAKFRNIGRLWLCLGVLMGLY